VITLLVPPGAATGRRERPDEHEQHHLRVRRAAAGERVALRDGAGMVGTGRLVTVGSTWEVDVESVERHAPPAPLTLAVGAGDRERFAWLVEKAVELGATRIVPLVTAHTGGVASRLRDGHLEKLRRRALEATKQCGAAWALEVAEPEGLETFVTGDAPGHRWLADGAGDPPPADLDAAPVTIIIGPEGGLGGEERAEVVAAGFRPVTFGAHTLRFETAALAAAAAVTIARLRRTHG
jgi:16S rRNA (uracil1498-N3)-methyltransferase